MVLSVSAIYLIAQGLGGVGAFLGAVALSQKSDKHLKLFYMLAEGIMGIHFLLLDAYAAAAMAIVIVSRTLLSFNLKFKRLCWLFILMHIAVGGYFYLSWEDSLAIVGSCLACYAFYYLNGERMRYVFLSVSSLWLLHNIIKMSFGGIALESLYIVVTVIRLYFMRSDRLKATRQPVL